MDDTPGLGRPQQDDDQLRHTLTVHEVGERLGAAGVPRSERQIKRYCESDFLDAKKVPGPTGDQWFVAPHALPKLIGDLQQWQMQRAGHSETRPAMTEHVTPGKPNEVNVDTPGLGRPQQAMADKENKSNTGTTEVVTSSYVTQLETRINEKDEVIGLLKGQLVAKDQQIIDYSTRFGNLSDRFADTQKLLGAMQRMFAPLLGQGDPYSTSEKRDAQDVPNNPSALTDAPLRFSNMQRSDCVSTRPSRGGQKARLGDRSHGGKAYTIRLFHHNGAADRRSVHYSGLALEAAPCSLNSLEADASARPGSS
jgi:hypothetical protein